MQMFRPYSKSGNMFAWKATGQPAILYSRLNVVQSEHPAPSTSTCSLQTITRLETDHKLLTLSLCGLRIAPVYFRRLTTARVRQNRSRRHLDPQRAPNFHADPPKLLRTLRGNSSRSISLLDSPRDKVISFRLTLQHLPTLLLERGRRLVNLSANPLL